MAWLRWLLFNCGNVLKKIQDFRDALAEKELASDTCAIYDEIWLKDVVLIHPNTHGDNLLQARQYSATTLLVCVLTSGLHGKAKYFTQKSGYFLF